MQLGGTVKKLAETIHAYPPPRSSRKPLSRLGQASAWIKCFGSNQCLITRGEREPKTSFAMTLWERWLYLTEDHLNRKIKELKAISYQIIR